MTSLLDLPVELIRAICYNLDAASYLAFTATCQALHDPEYTEDQVYWRSLLSSTFRFPENPVAHHHGTQYHRFYRQIRTQSRVFTWGDNKSRQLHRPTRYDATSIHPAPIHDSPPSLLNPGIVCDIKASGWATCFLNSRGHLHAVGTLNNEDFTQPTNINFIRLSYPDGDAHQRIMPDGVQEPRFAVKSLSAGRNRIVACSDDQTLWEWDDFRRSAVDISALLLDHLSQSCRRVETIVAGWTANAALIRGVGIILWSMKRSHDATAPNFTCSLVPGTARTSGVGQDSPEAISSVVLLESFVLYSLRSGRLFAAAVNVQEQPELSISISTPFEVSLPKLYTRIGQTATQTHIASESTIIHVQGHFKRFAIFTSTDNVLVGNSQQLESLAAGQTLTLDAVLIPSLQGTRTISLAFGDHHFLALHADGSVTSYGSDCKSCGSLGLGPPSTAALRGVVYDLPELGFGSADGRLHTSAYETGRRVWFDKLRQTWTAWLAHGLAPLVEDGQLPYDALYEWIEEQGRQFPGAFASRHQQNDKAAATPTDGEGEPYFALAITASGWHSCALVLADDKVVQAREASCALPLHWADMARGAVQSVSEKDRDAFVSLQRQVADTHYIDPVELLRRVWARGLAPHLSSVYAWYDKQATDYMPIQSWKRRERRLSFREVV